MSKKMVVDRQDFEKNFLEAIKSFVPKCEFFPLYFIGGKLVTFCANRQENGTLALYLEHTPIACNMEEGDVVYVKDPQKLLSAVKMLTDERVMFKIKDHQLLCDTDSLKVTFTLYDQRLAKRDKTFWKPEKFETIRASFKDGIDVDKETLAKVRSACNVVDIDTVVLKKEEDDKMYLTVGSKKSNSITTQIPFSDDFSEESHFIKNLFMFIGKRDAVLYETEDEKLVGFREESDNGVKYYLVTKIPIKNE